MDDQKLLLSLAEKFSPGQITGESGEVTLKYRLFVPDKPARVPLVVYLHGMGDLGDDNITQITATGCPVFYAQERIQAETPCAILCPQCPKTHLWAQDAVLEVLDALIEQTVDAGGIDPDRVYLTGLSLGGMGTFAMGARRPERFAALMPICGGMQEAWAARYGRLPIWAFHAEDDPIVPAGKRFGDPKGQPFLGSRLAVEAIRLQGGNAKYTEYPAGYIPGKWESAHHSWQEVYRDDAARAWLFQQSRA